MSRKVRVAHLITNLVVGGAQDYMLMIVKGLDQSVFEPVIAARCEGEWVEVVKSLPGIEVYDISNLRREVAPLRDIASIYEIRRFCREQKIDILHTHSSKPGVVGRLGGYFAGIPTVHTIHGFSFHDFMPKWKKHIFVFIERFMSRFTTFLLLYSHGNKLTAERLGISARKAILTFYYGVDYSPFVPENNRSQFRQSLGISPADYVIGFTGRFSEQKGLHVLVEAFAKIHADFPETRLLLVGDGHLRKRLEAQADDLGIRDSLLITGFRSDVSKILSAMDLFVMTSLWEGLSRSLAEAMYAKLPIVATDVGGTSDAIRNNDTGWLIPPNDVPATESSMRYAIQHPDIAKRYAEAGYQWARTTFNLNTMHEKMADLYLSLTVGKT